MIQDYNEAAESQPQDYRKRKLKQLIRLDLLGSSCKALMTPCMLWQMVRGSNSTSSHAYSCCSCGDASDTTFSRTTSVGHDNVLHGDHFMQDSLLNRVY